MPERTSPARLSCLLVLVWTGLAPAGLVAAAAGDALVLGEMALELSRELATDESYSSFPVPDLSRPGSPATPSPPLVDGRLDDDFWLEATVFPWMVLGDSALRMPFAWTFFAARSGDALYLAGELEGEVSVGTRLSLDASWRERIVVRLEPGSGVSARAECATSTAPIGGDGIEFAGSLGAGGGRWELRLPVGNTIFPLPLGAATPLRFTASRGRAGELFLSPPFRLIRARSSVRVLSLELDPGGQIAAHLGVTNLADGDIEVRTGFVETATLPPGATETISFRDPPLVGGRTIGWVFQVGPVGARLGLGTAFVDTEALRERVADALTACAGNIGRYGDPGGTLGSRLRSLAQRQTALSGRDLRPLEDLYVEARSLRRQTLFGALPAGIEEILFVRRFHRRAGPFYTRHLHDMPGGNLSVLSLRDGTLRDLLELPADASVRDPDLHPDGRRVVFALRHSGSGTHLHEVLIDGTAHREITDGDAHDIEPCYLPGQRIVFTSTRHRASSPISRVANTCLHVVSQDGRDIRRLSYNNLVDFTPDVLPDGRIIFTRWVHEDKPGNFINALWTIYPDGRGLTGSFGMERVGVATEARPIPGTNRIVCLDSGPNGHWRSPHVGDIAVAEIRQGNNQFLYRIAADRGGYKTPFAVRPGVFLVSWGWTDTRWAIYLVDRHGQRELIHRDAELSCFDPLPVRRRPVPNEIPALVSEDPGAPARVLVQNVHEGLVGVEPGRVKSLRVVLAPDRPEDVAREPFLDRERALGVAQRMVRRELGTVPVRADGSVSLELPANTNLFFQLLDLDGNLVQTMRDTTHFAPGEERACIGCHEQRSLAPPPNPRSLEALNHPAVMPRLGGRSASVSFPRDIQPILDRWCLPCHDAARPAGGIVLSGDPTPLFSLAYETLTRGGAGYAHQTADEAPGAVTREPLAAPLRYVTRQIAAGTTGSGDSRLLDLIDSGHADVEMDDEERRAIARWIDFNLPYYEDWKSGRGATPGARRLLDLQAQRTIESLMRMRCRGCHLPPDLERGAAISLSRPELSPILMAPLPRARGGTGACRRPVFRGRDDGVYRLVLGVLRREAGRLPEGLVPGGEGSED